MTSDRVSSSVCVLDRFWIFHQDVFPSVRWSSGHHGSFFHHLEPHSMLVATALSCVRVHVGMLHRDKVLLLFSLV